eukprot:4526493-Amphidinium_carterae.1
MSVTGIDSTQEDEEAIEFGAANGSIHPTDLRCTLSASGTLCSARCMMKNASTWTKPKMKKAWGACAMHSSPDNSQIRIEFNAESPIRKTKRLLMFA